MTSIFPKQPGYSVYHDPSKTDFKKISSIILQKKHHGDYKLKKDYLNSISNNSNLSNNAVVRDGSSLSYSQSTFVNHFDEECKSIKDHFQPDWVKLDKQVLRFYGYFKESVDESKIENARIRKVILYYYLVDDTIEITEPKESDSGIVQGSFLKRRKVPKAEIDSYKDSNSFIKYADNTAQYISFRDLKIGDSVYIYGKWITLNDCDKYTREFYNKLSLDPYYSNSNSNSLNSQYLKQPNSISVPNDNFHMSKSLAKCSNQSNKNDNLMKDWLEHRLGGGKVKNQKQFLENDRRVLKFNASHDSLKYVINYYLADDTVEIKELYFPNSGRRKFPLFLKRNKLPKKFSISQPGEEVESQYVKPADIEPFMTLWAFNRPFRILGCDKFTHDYYLDKFQKKFPIGGFEDAPTKDKSTYEYPPYNGFGDELDSLSNCNRLIPKPVKKDYFKYIDNDKVILRFLAKLNSNVPEDQERRFLISFFMSDDSIQVYEMQNRNSGIWEGKFLERGKYKNIENENKKFTISDFQINKSIKINTFSLCILDADDFTKKWMNNNLV